MIKKDIIERIREKFSNTIKKSAEDVIDEHSEYNMNDFAKLKIINESANGMSNAMSNHLDYTNSLTDLINTRNEHQYIMLDEDVQDQSIMRVLKRVLREYSKMYDIDDIDDLKELHEDLTARIVDMNAKTLECTIALANVEKLMRMMDKK